MVHFLCYQDCTLVTLPQISTQKCKFLNSLRIINLYYQGNRAHTSAESTYVCKRPGNTPQTQATSPRDGQKCPVLLPPCPQRSCFQSTCQTSLSLFPPDTHTSRRFKPQVKTFTQPSVKPQVTASETRPAWPSCWFHSLCACSRVTSEPCISLGMHHFGKEGSSLFFFFFLFCWTSAVVAY